MSEWREVKLGEICDYVNRGITPRYVENNGKIILNQKCIRNGNINYTFAKMTSASKNYVEEKKLLEGDILINSTGVGTAGRVSIFDKKDTTYVDSHVSIVRLNSKISHSKFIFYNLFGREKEIENYAEGSTGQIELGREKIKDIDLNLPPLSEQKAIASVLSSLDDKIDLLHRQNETLEKMAETLFRQWFVEEAKDDWEEVTLDEILTVKGGTTPSTSKNEYWDGNICWTSPRDITNNKGIYFFDTERKITELGLSKISSGLLPKGTLLMTSRAPVGVLAFAEMPIAINQGYIAIIDDKGFSKEFIFLWLKHNMDYVHSFSNGSTFYEISKSAFKSLKIQNYPSDIRGKFQIVISPIFNRIKTNQIQISTLTNLRDRLLPKLMSGEVRVDVQMEENR